MVNCSELRLLRFEMKTGYWGGSTVIPFWVLAFLNKVLAPKLRRVKFAVRPSIGEPSNVVVDRDEAIHTPHASPFRSIFGVVWDITESDVVEDTVVSFIRK